MFQVYPNGFHSYLWTSVGPSQMKILFTSYYHNIAFWNTVLSQKFLVIFFLLISTCQILQSEISWRNPVKYNVLYTAGVCPTYLFVAGSISLLQCLSMIHKNGTNLRNDEMWRLLLLEQIPTFGELDKINITSNRWKRNKFTWHLLQQAIDLR